MTAIQELAERNVPFRALVRSRSRAQSLPKLPGMEVVIGNFDDAESLRRTLEGMERAFLVRILPSERKRCNGHLSTQLSAQAFGRL